MLAKLEQFIQVLGILESFIFKTLIYSTSLARFNGNKAIISQLQNGEINAYAQHWVY